MLLLVKKKDTMQQQTENRRSKHSDTVVDEFFPVLVHFHISSIQRFSSQSVFHIVYRLCSNILRHNYHVNLDSCYAINVDSDQQNILRVLQ